MNTKSRAALQAWATILHLHGPFVFYDLLALCILLSSLLTTTSG
jgi:hypothetical protein